MMNQADLGTNPDTWVSTVFTIPPNPDKADALLGELGEMATATDWKRAAIVYARTRQGMPGRPSQELADNSHFLSFREFAKLGIHGLTHHSSVSLYRSIWQRAVDTGIAEPVSLGDTVTLPDLDWTRDTAWPLKPQPEPEPEPEAAQQQSRHQAPTGEKRNPTGEKAKRNDRNDYDRWAKLLFQAVGPDRAEAVYRALAKVLHPDTPTGDTRLQQQLNAAYSKLNGRRTR
jgi:hypothetical protein